MRYTISSSFAHDISLPHPCTNLKKMACQQNSSITRRCQLQKILVSKFHHINDSINQYFMSLICRRLPAEPLEVTCTCALDGSVALCFCGCICKSHNASDYGRCLFTPPDLNFGNDFKWTVRSSSLCDKFSKIVQYAGTMPYMDRLLTLLSRTSRFEF